MSEKTDKIIGNKNVVTCRTPHYDKIRIKADKQNIKVSAVVREIIDFYFSLDLERADLLLDLIDSLKRGVTSIEEFSGLAEQVETKFSSMNSAESYYFRQIDAKLNRLLNVMSPKQSSGQNSSSSIYERMKKKDA